MSRLLTTAEVAERYGVKADTVKHWCQREVIVGAEKEGVGNRATWFIPESSLEGFVPPKRGAPTKPNSRRQRRKANQEDEHAD